MEIKKLACELESWAQEKGWKTVTQLITRITLAICFSHWMTFRIRTNTRAGCTTTSRLFSVRSATILLTTSNRLKP